MPNRSFVVELCKYCWHHSHSNHIDFVGLMIYARVTLADDRLLGKRSSEQLPIGSTPGLDRKGPDRRGSPSPEVKYRDWALGQGCRELI